MSEQNAKYPPQPFVLGWEEWLALPDLGLPAVKAKIDTGARTSALHAFLIEPFGSATQPMVRFGIHPIPGRHDIEIYCSAQVVDRRDVTSSNGEKETRTVICSRVEVGGRAWPIEITLTNRETMTYRMLLGRQAISDDVFVDPSASFRQPKLSYKLYRHLPRHDLVRRTLRVAVVASDPDRPFNRRLAAAATARGHVLEMIDSRELSLGASGGGPLITAAGRPLGHYDAVVPRLMARDGGLAVAVVRELELTGSTALNSAAGLDLARAPLAAIQRLVHAGLPVSPPELDGESPDGRWSRRRQRSLLRFVAVGGRIAASMTGRSGHMVDLGDRRHKAERRIAETAAKLLGLGLAQVDLVQDGDQWVIGRVSAAPALGSAETTTGVRLAELIVSEIENRSRSWVRRTDLSSNLSDNIDD